MIEGCDNRGYPYPSQRGLCGKHLTRWHRYGDPHYAAESHDIEERIEFLTEKSEDGCWIWKGTIKSTGYGQTSYKGRLQGAHRVVYEVKVGPIPEGLDLDHLCRVRHCVNPEHLEPVSRGENIRRSPIMTHPSQADRINKRG